MPMTCIVVNCGSRADRDRVSFYNIPTLLNFKHKPHLNQLSKQRREKWLVTIKRADLTESKIKFQRVCSKHFITGKPAKLEDVNHPDWVPSVEMGYSNFQMKNQDSLNRSERAIKRQKIVHNIPSTSTSMSIEEQDEPGFVAETGVALQTDLTCEDLAKQFEDSVYISSKLVDLSSTLNKMLLWNHLKIMMIKQSTTQIATMMKDETEIQILQNEIANLKAVLREKEKRLHELRFNKNVQNPYTTELSAEEISRYSRQMLIPDVGVSGQVALKKSKVLIVGTGGLGCPAALYLAAAGVGEITLVDNDEVDITNLHRQVLHAESDVGVRKVQSGFDSLTRINSNIKVVPKHMHADGQSLLSLLQENEYSVVVDGTDNVATRYLLNDLCVLNNIPLVSGSALQLEGQLTVYNHNNGPCYRCLFPVPPPPDTVTSCGDGGVLGVVPGLIGVLEALETIKIILGMAGVLSGRLLIFDGTESTFCNVKLRNKKPNCEVCGVAPVITAPIDYEQFCGAKAHDKVENINILEADENVNVKDFSHAFKDNDLLLDVRPPLEFKMCQLPNSLNIPYTDIQKQKNLEDLKTEIKQRCTKKDSNVYVICRRGNDSQRAVHKLKDEFSGLPVKFVNIRGGLHAYSKLIDSCFPIY